MDLKELERQVTLMEDIQAIENLQRMYGYYFDTRQHKAIVDLFSENTVSVEIESHGRFLGKDGVRRMFWMDRGDPPKEPRRRPPGIMTAIMQLGGVVNVNPDGKSATGRWQTWLAESFPFGGRLGQYWLQGYYENEYVKEDGKWLFSKLFWNTTFYTRFETGWMVQPVVGFLPRDDADNAPTAFLPYPSGYKFPYSFPHPITGEVYDPGDTYQDPMAM
jgi:hypothetical protein